MRRRTLVSLWFICSALVVRPLTAEPESRDVIPAKTAGVAVSPEAMQTIYEQVKTPFKYGVVLRQDGRKVDCPSVFRHDDRWHMLYIVFDGSGYETHIAASDDLLHWEQQGKVLSTTQGTWDAVQKAGFIALQDYTWGGDYHVEKSADRYWISYVGGALKGYETDPLSIGMAWSETLTGARPWHRLSQAVLSPVQEDARYWEKLTL